MTLILDGTACAHKREVVLRDAIAKLETKPKLVIVMVGDDPRSAVYISRKVACAERIGTESEVHRVPVTVSQQELESLVCEQSNRSDVHGIIIQTPLPAGIHAGAIFDAIDPNKDVDGLGMASTRKLNALARHEFTTLKGHVPATARGVITLLKENAIPLAGAKVAVIGRSFVVGLPLALAFLAEDATVTVCHSKTKDLAESLSSADIIVAAMGVQKCISKEHVRAGQVIVDVGISLYNGKLAGDVDFDAVFETVAAISPVPKGVGPMTVVSLFENLLDAAVS